MPSFAINPHFQPLFIFIFALVTHESGYVFVNAQQQQQQPQPDQHEAAQFSVSSPEPLITNDSDDMSQMMLIPKPNEDFNVGNVGQGGVGGGNGGSTLHLPVTFPTPTVLESEGGKFILGNYSWCDNPFLINMLKIKPRLCKFFSKLGWKPKLAEAMEPVAVDANQAMSMFDFHPQMPNMGQMAASSDSIPSVVESNAFEASMANWLFPTESSTNNAAPSMPYNQEFSSIPSPSPLSPSNIQPQDQIPQPGADPNAAAFQAFDQYQAQASQVQNYGVKGGIQAFASQMSPMAQFQANSPYQRLPIQHQRPNAPFINNESEQQQPKKPRRFRLIGNSQGWLRNLFPSFNQATTPGYQQVSQNPYTLPIQSPIFPPQSQPQFNFGQNNQHPQMMNPDPQQRPMQQPNNGPENMNMFDKMLMRDILTVENKQGNPFPVHFSIVDSSEPNFEQVMGDVNQKEAQPQVYPQQQQVNQQAQIQQPPIVNGSSFYQQPYYESYNTNEYGSQFSNVNRPAFYTMRPPTYNHQSNGNGYNRGNVELQRQPNKPGTANPIRNQSDNKAKSQDVLLTESTSTSGGKRFQRIPHHGSQELAPGVGQSAQNGEDPSSKPMLMPWLVKKKQQNSSWKPKGIFHSGNGNQVLRRPTSTTPAPELDKDQKDKLSQLLAAAMKLLQQENLNKTQLAKDALSTILAASSTSTTPKTTTSSQATSSEDTYLWAKTTGSDSSAAVRGRGDTSERPVYHPTKKPRPTASTLLTSRLIAGTESVNKPSTTSTVPPPTTIELIEEEETPLYLGDLDTTPTPITIEKATSEEADDDDESEKVPTTKAPTTAAKKELTTPSIASHTEEYEIGNGHVSIFEGMVQERYTGPPTVRPEFRITTTVSKEEDVTENEAKTTPSIKWFILPNDSNKFANHESRLSASVASSSTETLASTSTSNPTSEIIRKAIAISTENPKEETTIKSNQAPTSEKAPITTTESSASSTLFPIGLRSLDRIAKIVKDHYDMRMFKAVEFINRDVIQKQVIVPPKKLAEQLEETKSTTERANPIEVATGAQIEPITWPAEIVKDDPIGAEMEPIGEANNKFETRIDDEKVVISPLYSLNVYPRAPRDWRTDFACQGKRPGFYVDVHSKCQMFHHCGDRGYHQTFICPNGTRFNMKDFHCDLWYRVDCHLNINDPKNSSSSSSSSSNNHTKLNNSHSSSTSSSSSSSSSKDGISGASSKSLSTNLMAVFRNSASSNTLLNSVQGKSSQTEAN